jgi:hypothetical protein
MFTYVVYLKLTVELEKLGYKYTAKFGEEETPQSLYVSVGF